MLGLRRTGGAPLAGGIESWEMPIGRDLVPHLDLGELLRLPDQRTLYDVSVDAVDALTQLAGVVAAAATDPPVARGLAAEQRGAFGLPAERIDDLEFVVTELVTDSLRHADGRGDLPIWSEDGHVVCQVGDAGRLVDPLAGRRPAEAGRLGGRGLLMVNEVADLVRMPTDATGTAICAYLRRHTAQGRSLRRHSAPVEALRLTGHGARTADQLDPVCGSGGGQLTTAEAVCILRTCVRLNW